jgi:hypothetical protein
MAAGLPEAAARPEAAPAPSPVTPAVVHQSLDPGDSMAVAKRVLTPAIPPKPDIVFLMDATNSMNRQHPEDPPGALERLRAGLPQIMDDVTAQQPDARFGLAAFGDEVDTLPDLYTVNQPLTTDKDAVTTAADNLVADRAFPSKGPSEDWINGLWEIANGSEGRTVFRPDASPVVVLMSDSSSHDPSNGHSLTDTIFALQDAHIRVVAVDLDTQIGDGLDGNGDAGDPDYKDPEHTANEGHTVVTATNGRFIEEVQPEAIAEGITEGLTNLPTSIGYRLDQCSPALHVSLDPPVRTVDSGSPADFAETITASPDAPQGARLTCTVQFLQGNTVPGTGDIDPGAEADPAMRESITIDVNDVDAPVVTVDDRTVSTTGPGGAKVVLTATAQDAQDGALPVTCSPASGSVFPVGRTTVTCSATDTSGNTGTDTATVEVLQAPVPPLPPVPPTADVAVQVRVAPSTAYTGQAARAGYTLTNAGPDTATGVILTSAWPTTPDAGKRTLAPLTSCTPTAPCSIPAGGRLTVTQSATYRTAISGDVVATAVATLPDRDATDNTARDHLRVLQPKLTVTPQVATTGDVVLARGSDYPPGRTVRLSWSTGITAAASPVKVGADGTFEAQVLVLRKDVLGPRMLRASVTGVGRLQKKVLVVQPELEPPDFAGRG